jgi:hypothetical protein
VVWSWLIANLSASRRSLLDDYQNCGRLSRILTDRFGLGEKEVAFFDLFANPPATFEANALNVIQHGLDRGIEPRLIQRAARLLQAYELMYWDTLYGKSSSAGEGE